MIEGSRRLKGKNIPYGSDGSVSATLVLSLSHIIMCVLMSNDGCWDHKKRFFGLYFFASLEFAGHSFAYVARL
jgi:hypothetical protein